MLESMVHADSSFVTLTYAPENLPKDGSLVPKDLQDWLKRLRKALSPRSIRYYVVGEYGDESWRPHYHGALFGISHLEQKVVEDTWQLGFVSLGELTIKSASYIAGYVTKKMSKKEDPRLCGRHPEFARMSLKPGIGAAAMNQVASAISSLPNMEKAMEDVPGVLQHGIKRLPLGRYLRRKLREKVGRSQETPQASLDQYAEELRGMFRDALQDETLTKNSRSWSSLYANIKKQEIRNQESKLKIYGAKRGVL